MSVVYQCYSVIIDQGISAPGHDKEVVDWFNAVDKRYIYKLMSNVQLPGTNRFDSQMQIHTGNQNNDVSLAKQFQHYLTKEHSTKMVSLIRADYKKSWWENGQTDSSIIRIMMMLHTKMWEFIVT